MVGAARVFGRIVLFPIVLALFVLAPIVYTVRGFLAAGGVVAALVFEFSAVGPRFPFLAVLGMAVSTGVMALLYLLFLLYIIGE